ncbi:hypothetical protein [Actinoplanes auranticolor]|uniref:Uncharacterized protein n=1 Tax=Actinoplanes auranticolor TaxID=47988 RepID=A0A919S8S1_9ACTN|nr:hypothetical protein [Actinoplanes auranticolor]GIM66984.1 hypothetical protein Aau02nite_25400 [Actinoplanes auranticolor]
MSATITDDLDRTVISGWHTRLATGGSPRRSHWQTKIIYYRSVTDLLTVRPDRTLTWKTIVTGARPHGRRSTFYEVAGGHARHRMIDDLLHDGGSDAIQLALRYLRTDPVEQLIDETKVWSYWPYRERLLADCRQAGLTGEQMEEALTAVVSAWARGHAALAAAVHHSPPACAVEDLVVLRRGRLAAAGAANRLSDVIRRAATPD